MAGLGLHATVVKGRLLESTDAAFRRPTEELLEKLEALPPDGFKSFGKDVLNLWKGPKEIRHVEQEFLGDDPEVACFPAGGRIPDSAGKEAIMLSGYIQALRVALYNDPDTKPRPRHKRSEPLPIVAYWIAGVRHFEVYVTLSSTDREVHLMILTPEPNVDDHVPALGRDENIWVIGTDDRIKELREHIPWTYEPRAAFALKNAQCQKLQSCGTEI